MEWRAAGLSPVARFSMALGLVLAAMAAALGGVTAFLIGRYVEDETVTFTQDAVAGHFGTVFQNSVFQRPLTQAEKRGLEQNVVFHFSIYNVVATRFYAPDGTIVFSYDDSEIGRRLVLIENQRLAAALTGQRSSTHRTIVADARFARPGFTYSEAMAYAPPPVDHSGHAVSLGTPDVRKVQTLETWVPVTAADGKLVGAVTVWRDIRTGRIGGAATSMRRSERSNAAPAPNSTRPSCGPSSRSRWTASRRSTRTLRSVSVWYGPPRATSDDLRRGAADAGRSSGRRSIAPAGRRGTAPAR